jgi:RecA-family ATPase
MMSGEPGLGKSQIAVDVGARITCGSKWPDGGRAPLGSVILLSAEDAADDAIRPRLEVAGENGADVRRVHVVTTVTGEGGD